MIKNPNTKPLKNPYLNQRRASVSGLNGSMTIEAALTIPIFLFAVLCLIYLLEIQTIELRIKAAAQEAAKQAAEDIIIVPILNTYSLQQDIIENIGSERLERSIIEGGSGGIQCWTSYYNSVNEEVIVKVNYKIKLPVPGFLNLDIKKNVELKVKAWTGQVEHEDSDDEEIVYVTDTGSVYHTNYQCAYLQLSITFLPSSSLIDVRNESGGIYQPCEKCVHGQAMAGVYITKYGTKYHNSLSCSGVKRSIRAVKKSDVIGMGGCVKCAR